MDTAHSLQLLHQATQAAEAGTPLPADVQQWLGLGLLEYLHTRKSMEEALELRTPGSKGRSVRTQLQQIRRNEYLRQALELCGGSTKRLADLVRRFEVGNALPSEISPDQQPFTAPGGAVRAVAGAVEYDRTDLLLRLGAGAVLAEHGKCMGQMVLHAQQRHISFSRQLLADPCARVVGMEIADDGLRPHPEKRLHSLGRFHEKGPCPVAVEIADML